MVAYQETKQQWKEKLCKALFKEKEKQLQGRITVLAEREQEILAREQSRVTLVDSINNSIATFPPEVGKEDEDSLAKVTRLTKITQDLWL